MEKYFFKPALLVALCILAGCAQKFTSANFQEKAQDHKVIAVLPFNVTYTGDRPSSISEVEVHKMELAEGLAFQKDFYGSLLDYAGNRKKNIGVKFQDVSRTNKLLEKSNLGIVDLYRMVPEQVAKLLKVDAVLMAEIEKEKFISDISAYDIDVNKKIMGMVLEEPTTNGQVADADGKTYVIKYDAYIINKNDGSILWKLVTETESDWNVKPEEVVNSFNKKSAKNFPYRQSS